MATAHASSRSANPQSPTGSTTRLEDGPQATQTGFTIVGTLRLRAEPVARRSIRWADDVVDNEGMGRKSSKVCCIYHKPRAVGESSSEDDSDSSSSDSNSDSEPDNSKARKAKSKKPDPHDHGHGDGCEHDHTSSSAKSVAKKKGKARKGANAYERMPKGSSTKTQTMK